MGGAASDLNIGAESVLAAAFANGQSGFMARGRVTKENEETKSEKLQKEYLEILKDTCAVYGQWE